MSGPEGDVPRPLSHADVEELLGSYALDAVDAAEAEAIELHLADCGRCRAEVAEHREVAALLGNAGNPAPAHLWDRIAASLDEPPPDLSILTGPSPRGQPRLIRRRVAVGLAAVAAAAAAVIGVLAFEVHHLDNRVNSLAQTTPTQGLSQLATAAVFDPQAQRVDLRSTRGNESAQGVILPNGSGYLVNLDLRPLSSLQTYQLWAVRGTRQVSLGVLGSDPKEAAFSVGSPKDLSALAVTVEASGGVERTAKQPVISGTV